MIVLFQILHWCFTPQAQAQDPAPQTVKAKRGIEITWTGVKDNPVEVKLELNKPHAFTSSGKSQMDIFIDATAYQVIVDGDIMPLTKITKLRQRILVDEGEHEITVEKKR